MVQSSQNMFFDVDINNVQLFGIETGSAKKFSKQIELVD